MWTDRVYCVYCTECVVKEVWVRCETFWVTKSNCHAIDVKLSNRCMWRYRCMHVCDAQRSKQINTCDAIDACMYAMRSMHMTRSCDACDVYHPCVTSSCLLYINVIGSIPIRPIPFGPTTISIWARSIWALQLGPSHLGPTFRPIPIGPILFEPMVVSDFTLSIY